MLQYVQCRLSIKLELCKVFANVFPRIMCLFKKIIFGAISAPSIINFIFFQLQDALFPLCIALWESSLH